MYKINLESTAWIRGSNPDACHGCLSVVDCCVLLGRDLCDGTTNCPRERVCLCVCVSFNY